MKIFIPKENDHGETRSAMIPAVVKKLAKDDIQVVVEAGTGLTAHITDEAFTKVGATLGSESDWADADAVLMLHRPTEAQVGQLKPGAVVIGMLQPTAHTDLMQKLADQQVTAISMEYIPRISRAQSMDVLSSQANIGGYKAVLLGANHCAKMFPMMITAAGTLAPAKVFIIGVGVAGLQAIATAKRLGAIVEAYDVRPATKEQVLSLGARFVELPMDTAEAETAGGYAKEQTDEDRQKQTELMTRHITGADVVITTAAVFGKAPPMLIPADIVANMSHGSVIVDMAANPDHGRGNCELTRPDEVTTTDNGVTIIGTLNLPALVPTHASQGYANNMFALLKELIVEGELKINLEDEVQKGAVITHSGAVVHEAIAGATAST